MMRPAANPSPRPRKAAKVGSGVVLFVDDDPLLLRGLRRYFMDWCEVLTASSGQEALALLRGSNPVQVAVVDHQLPGMSGVDLLRALRQSHPDTVRIMLSGQADLQIATEAINQGQVFRFLTKPADMAELQRMIGEAMEAHRQRQEENRLMAQALALAWGGDPAREASALQQLLEARLTPREMDVLRLIGQGRASKEIAPHLGISPRTVDVHRSHILEKLTLHNSTSLVRVAVKAGLV